MHTSRSVRRRSVQRSRRPGARGRFAAAAAAAALVGGLAAAPAASAAAPSGGLPSGLGASLAAVHQAGMPGVFAQVRDGNTVWRGASGAADTATGRPVTPGMQQRVGSITKAFTSVALLKQVAAGRLDLDAPIGRYLPEAVPGERGQQITVRMLLNHTSGIGDYVAYAFPSLQQNSAASLDAERFTHRTPAELVKMGLAAPATGAPGEKWSYSNTNYVLAGMLLAKLTGGDAEAAITRDVIRPAGLHHTYFPRSPWIAGPHPKMYESLYGIIDPPEDFSVYDMSWASTAGALVSTTDDLERFYRALLGGRLLPSAQLAEMEKTVPAATGPDGRVLMAYGLGIYRVNPGCGWFWGHDGAVWGAGTQVLSSPDGKRQAAYAINEMKYQHLDANGQIEESPIDDALDNFLVRGLCGTGSTGSAGEAPHAAGAAPALPTAELAPNRPSTVIR